MGLWNLRPTGRKSANVTARKVVHPRPSVRPPIRGEPWSDRSFAP
jgi:hypothetical protein